MMAGHVDGQWNRVGLPCSIFWCVKADLDEFINETVGARSYGCRDLDHQGHCSGDGDFCWEQNEIRIIRLVWAPELAI
jgi:hypothetical protein